MDETEAEPTNAEPTNAEPTNDPVMNRVMGAVAFGHAGDRPRARAALLEVWRDVGDDGDPFHRCVIAHYLADVTEDPLDELAWDERALDAALETSDARAKAHHASLSIAGFFPSLHLNLADVLRRLGRFEEASTHVEHAAARTGVLGDDPYGTTIRDAITDVQLLIATRDTTVRESAPSA